MTPLYQPRCACTQRRQLLGWAALASLALLGGCSQADNSAQALVPEEIDRAASDYAPQRIARYAYDIAALFHSFYNKCRIMGTEPRLAEARLALVTVTAHVIRHSLGILGVSAPEHM